MPSERYELYRLALPAIQEEPLAPNGKWLFLSAKWFGLIQSLIGELENPKVWLGTKEEIQRAINHVIEIEMQQLDPTKDCEECDDGSSGGNGGDIPKFWGISENELYDLAEELAEEMSMCSRCDIYKMIRQNGDVIEICVNDPCEGVKWLPIQQKQTSNTPSSELSPRERANAALNSLRGKTVSPALLDSEGSPTDEKIVLPPPRFNVGANKYELRKCNKATQLVDTTLSLLEVIYEIDSPANNLVDLIPENITDFVVGVTGIFGSLLPAPLSGYVRAIGLAYWLDDLRSEVKDEIVEIVENKVIRREQAICYVASSVGIADEIVGQDLIDVLVGLGVVSGNISELALMWSSVDIEGLYNYFAEYEGSVDCGCPEIVARGNYSPSAAPAKPSAAVWSVEANLKTGQHGTRLFEMGNPQWGAYESGVGYVNSSFDFEDVEDATQFTRVLIDWQVLTGRILRVDWYAENVVEGLFQSNSGTPNADIEKFLVYVNADQQNTQYVDNGAGWRYANFGQTFANINLWWFWGYCEISSSGGGQTSSGQGTVTKIRIHGTGTKPQWFVDNGWTDV